MYKYAKVLIQKYFEEQSFVDSDIESFNNFVDKELVRIIEENREIIPTIIPHNIDEFKIRLDEIWVSKPGHARPDEEGHSGPSVIEADGSKRMILPMEARLRKITYSSPTWITVSAHINGVQRENVKSQICNLPIMLKSKWCHLNKLSRDELISKGEDPDEPGGYFIINGTEKVLITIEDLASNRFLIEKDSTGPSEIIGKLFSEYGSFKIPHTLEKMKDGLFYLTFTRVKRVPIIVVIKALGLIKDEEITKFISAERQFDDIIINLLEFVDIKTDLDALDYIAKKIGITQSKEVRIERTREILDKYLLPHLGIKTENRIFKAYNLCKMLKKCMLASIGRIGVDDKDHYLNKRLKMSGDLLGDLVRLNLKVLIGDLLYNFQRIVKRGKFPSLKNLIREKLITDRIESAMATGVWVGGRKGISQRIQKLNYLESMSHLQRVVSPLSASQENFAARELHPTHLGRLCPIETPEGTNIGLRKNLALLCTISGESNEQEIIKSVRGIGLKVISQ